VFVISILIPPEVLAQNTGYVRRYAANRLALSGGEISTNLPPADNAEGGLIIYNKNFFVADDINTLYVTISATGDSHFGARLMLACKVDGVPCNPDFQFVGGAPSGWFTALRMKDYDNDYVQTPTGLTYTGDGGGGAGDVHDNTITYTWCAPFETKAGTHNVQVKMASRPGPGDSQVQAVNFVFMEAVHFFIDGARVRDETARCSAVAPVEPTVATAPSTTTAPDGTIIDTTTFVPLTEPSLLSIAPQIQIEIP
jgi:hypothetical protein